MSKEKKVVFKWCGLTIEAKPTNWEIVRPTFFEDLKNLVNCAKEYYATSDLVIVMSRRLKDEAERNGFATRIEDATGLKICAVSAAPQDTILCAKVEDGIYWAAPASINVTRGYIRPKPGAVGRTQVRR